jgi:predicted component of type VI protein secretion system
MIDWLPIAVIIAAASTVALGALLIDLWEQPRELTPDEIARAGDAFLATFEPRFHAQSDSVSGVQQHGE